MATTICRPFITLKNGKRLYAFEKGIQAFCFEVDEERPKTQESPTVRTADDS